MGKYKRAIVQSAPITERYWFDGCEAQIDEANNQIRVGGCWFPFGDKWEVEYV